MALIEFCDIETKTITVVNARKITRVKIFTDEKTGRTGTRISIPGEVIYTNETIEEVVRRWNIALSGKQEIIKL
jgi:hypothetical protein